MLENEVKKSIMLAFQRKYNGRIFNNPVGTGHMGRVIKRDANSVTLQAPRVVSFGLATSSCDLIGIRPIVITADMIGQKIGQFVALEIKTARFKGPKTEHELKQQNFIDMVQNLGGMAKFVTCEGDL